MAIATSRKALAGKSTPARRGIPTWQRSNFGLPADSTDKLIHLLAKGLPIGAFTLLAEKTGIPIPELASILRIPARTLARRRASGRLTAEESERLMRLINIFEKTVQLFEGRVGPAVTWLRSPKKALSNHTPLEYASFEISAREVENLIGRLEHGIFS